MSRPHLNRRAMTALPLALTVYCCVSGGPYGLEPLIGASGIGLGLLLILLTPIFWALPDALTTAELASAIPEEGGYVIWVKRAMGPFAGFLNAWWTWLYALVDAAIYPVLFTGYLNAMLKGFGLPFFETDLSRWLVSLVVIALFTALNIRGTKLVGQTSSVFAVLLIVPFVLLAIVGFARVAQTPAHFGALPFLPEGSSLREALVGGLGVVMWNYLGWDTLSTIAEEVDQPERAYPRALLLGMPLVTLVYFLPTLASVPFVRDLSVWQDGAWPAIAEGVGGRWLGFVVNFAGLISPIALFTASLLGSSRVPFVLAADGYLPKGLVDIHPKFGTPWKAILLCAVVYAFLTWSTFQALVALNVVMYGSALVLECVSLAILRVKEPNLPRPFRVAGGWPVLGIIALLPLLLVSLLVVLSIQEEGWRAQWLTGVALASAPVVYGALKLSRTLRA